MKKGIKQRIKNNKIIGTIVVKTYRLARSVLNIQKEIKLYKRTKKMIKKDKNSVNFTILYFRKKCYNKMVIF